jgi:hypothetical protein
MKYQIAALPAVARNDIFLYQIAALPAVARNDIFLYQIAALPAVACNDILLHEIASPFGLAMTHGQWCKKNGRISWL